MGFDAFARMPTDYDEHIRLNSGAEEYVDLLGSLGSDTGLSLVSVDELEESLGEVQDEQLKAWLTTLVQKAKANERDDLWLNWCS
jgi:uncharacterized small protein (DUF1192 family)